MPCSRNWLGIWRYIPTFRFPGELLRPAASVAGQPVQTLARSRSEDRERAPPTSAAPAFRRAPEIRRQCRDWPRAA